MPIGMTSSAPTRISIQLEGLVDEEAEGCDGAGDDRCDL